MKPFIGFAAILALIPISLSAQVPEHSFGFGVELGQMNSVQISYTPFERIQTTAFMGPVLQSNKDLLPSDLGLHVRYFFSESRSTGFVGITGFAAYGRFYDYGVAVPVGMQHFVSENVAFFGHLSTALTNDNNSLTMFAGFGMDFTPFFAQ